MKSTWQFARRGTALVGVAVCSAMLLAGCGSGRRESSEEPEEETATNVAKKPVDAATTGSVSGTVKLDGTPRPRRTINMAAVPNCAKLRTSPAMTEDVVTGDNGALANVVVYLKGDLGGYEFEEKAPAMLDQKGCTYSPHVLALMREQKLQVSNSDDATHNVNAAPKSNRRWNESQSPGSGVFEQEFARAEVGIPVKCNIHPWMKAYISVFAHPYFEVTGADGSFKIENVPPGKYTLTTWHEFYGVKERAITVEPKQDQSAAVTYTDKDRL